MGHLAPFIIASALMPVELVITLALLGTPGRVRTASAAVSGMVLVRLLQGLVFGMILHWGRRDDTKGGHGWVVSSVLLVVAVVLLVTAIRELLGGDDPDDPPPKWMTALSSMTPGKAFLLGAAVILISVKLWVFTFAAIGAIGDAGMPRSTNVVNYIAVRSARRQYPSGDHRGRRVLPEQVTGGFSIAVCAGCRITTGSS